MQKHTLRVSCFCGDLQVVGQDISQASYSRLSFLLFYLIWQDNDYVHLSDVLSMNCTLFTNKNKRGNKKRTKKTRSCEVLDNKIIPIKI